jgi:oligopeptide/dipeptide ABC transporter ATP-binding protein
MSEPPRQRPLGAAVEVDDLRVHFVRRRGFRAVATVRAVDGVSFAIRAGETLGLAGESGSGKSTVARAMLRIVDPSGGRVRVGGRDIAALRGGELRAFRRQMQMVYQDPYDSLDPRMKVGATVEEALLVRGVPRHERGERAAELFARVGLDAGFTDRYPHELSGGQRQRVAIARALGVDPAVIVCDEAVSALDVSVRAQILNLLKDLQEDTGLSYLFISHDLSTMRFVADRVAVMYLGRLVETGTREEVFGEPKHPYTRALFAAVPVPGGGRERVRLTGEPPSPADPPPGCPFHPRCPLAADVCRTRLPELRPKEGGGLAACHLVPDRGRP